MRKLFSFMLMATALLIRGNAFGAAGQGHSEPQVGDVAKVSVDVAGVITTTYYATLQDAFDDLPDNSYPVTLQMLDNAVLTVSNGFEIHQYNNVTLDLNGKMISASSEVASGSQVILNKGTLTIIDESGTGEGIITSTAEKPDAAQDKPYPGWASNTITNYGTIYVKSGTINNIVEKPGAAQYAIDNHGTIIMEGGTLMGKVVIRTGYAALTKIEINGGEILGTLPIWAQLFKNQVADITINDGVLGKESNGTAISLEDWSNDYSALVKLHINNGTIYGDCRVEVATEECEITGGTFVKGTLKCSEYYSYPHNQIMTGGIFLGVSKELLPAYDPIGYCYKNKTTGDNNDNEVTQVTEWAKDNIQDMGDYWEINDGTNKVYLDNSTLNKTKFPDEQSVKNAIGSTLVFGDGIYAYGDGYGAYWAFGYPKESKSDYTQLATDANEYIATGFSAQEYDGNGHPEADLMITTTSTKETDNNGSWATPETWLPENAPDAATDVTIKNEIVVASGTAVAHGVTVNEGQIIVKNGAVLEIGAGGIKTNNHDIQPIIVEAGGTLRVGVGGVSKEAGTLNPVEIYNDGSNSGAFMINPNAQVNTMPEATIHLTTNVRKDRWQHLALPIENLTEHSNDKGAANAVYEWKNNDWDKLEIGWSEIEAFKGYDFTNNYEGEGQVTYTFKGQLIGIQNQGLSLIEGVNFFGNSYTAPISLSALFDQIDSDMESNTIEKTVYIYNSAELNYGFTSSLGIELEEMGYADLDFVTIAPLQGFWMNLQEGKGTAGTTLNYAKAVWNNTEELGKPQYAPSRKSSNNNFSTVATINVTAANGAADKVMLVEGEDFSSEFENGSDASKMMSEESFNLFAATENGNQSMVATDNLAGTILSFQAADAINYTLNFDHIYGNDYAVRDLKTGAIIPMVENGTYNFVAQPNSIEDRFEVVIRGISTNNEVVVAAPAVKGIYTAMGQYLGETTMWNNLPAGMYIVDGVRMVK